MKKAVKSEKLKVKSDGALRAVFCRFAIATISWVRGPSGAF
jgi:hypothetical protein